MVMLGMVSEIGFATLNILGNYLGFLLYIPTPTNQPRIFNVATNPEFFPHIHPTSTPNFAPVLQRSDDLPPIARALLGISASHVHPPIAYWCVLRRVAGWVAGGCWDDD